MCGSRNGARAKKVRSGSEVHDVSVSSRIGYFLSRALVRPMDAIRRKLASVVLLAK